MDIDSLSVAASDDVLFTPGYRIVAESYMETLRNSSDTKKITIDPSDAYVFEGDFYGYLNKQMVAPGYHWLIMRLNSIPSPLEFGPDNLELMIPNETTLSRILSIYNSSIKS